MVHSLLCSSLVAQHSSSALRKDSFTAACFAQIVASLLPPSVALFALPVRSVAGTPASVQAHSSGIARQKYLRAFLPALFVFPAPDTSLHDRAQQAHSVSFAAESFLPSPAQAHTPLRANCASPPPACHARVATLEAAAPQPLPFCFDQALSSLTPSALSASHPRVALSLPLVDSVSLPH